MSACRVSFLRTFLMNWLLKLRFFTGNVAGAEVVQCYYETLYASVVRPKKELVRFRKVFLEPGEKKNVDFFIDQEEFSYYGKNMETVSSGMKLRISIGNSSDHLVSENIIQV